MARDSYQEITDRIAAALEDFAAGRRPTPPWSQPWKGGVAGANAPHNGHTGHVYRGINLLLVWSTGYSDPRWYTFKQVSENYGASHVRKGEKGTQVVFFQFVQAKRDSDDEKAGRRIPLLRTYTIFNHAQIEWEAGREPARAEQPTVDAVEQHAAFVAVVEASGARVQHGGDRAFYAPGPDFIQVPAREAFASPDAYVAVVGHELVHWTGHTSRCARDLSGRFGSTSYAAEELVAEIGAAFLCADFGVPSLLDEQHIPYVADWIKVLRSDKYAIFTASRLAREAVAFLRRESAADSDATTEAA
jgi:antirestriction protein ArdC